MIRIWTSVAGTGLVLVALAGFIAVGGCGDVDRSPFASGDGALLDGGGPASVAPANRSFLVLGLPGLAKKATGVSAQSAIYTETAERPFALSAAGDLSYLHEAGNLQVRFKNYGDNSILRVKTAKLVVRENSIGYQPTGDLPAEMPVNKRDEVEITMAVTSGSTLSDVSVIFGPSGLTFTPAARLEVQLTGDMSRENLTVGGTIPWVVYHISSNGTITKIEAKAEVRSRSAKIKIDIPGFSQFDWDPVEAEGG